MPSFKEQIKEQTKSNFKLQPMVQALLEEVAADEVTGLGGGNMTAAAYDTAWVAMVRDPQDSHRLAFPASLQWLLKHQFMDGGWGGPASYTLLPTLAALLALLRAPEATEQVRLAAQRAEAYLRTALKSWSVRNHESVGFEVLAPGLFAALEKLGMVFDFPEKADLLNLYYQKLRIAGPELIYSGHSNLIHSLEAFGPALDYKQLKSQQAANGSYGCSPAATAAVLVYGPVWDEAAANWLTHLTERAFDGERGAMPNAYPVDVFEAGWIIYNLARAGFNFQHDFPQSLVQRLVAWLNASLLGPDRGASISRFVGMPTDSDNTGLVLAALNMAGVKTPISALLHFERPEYFACFELERGASLSANAHVLAALFSLPPLAQANLSPIITKVLAFLASTREAEGYWLDKWHYSPYYASACAGLALAESSDPTIRQQLLPTLKWLLATQSERDGGWGSGDFSTLEETAYALQVLHAVPDLIQPSNYMVYRRSLYRGIGYLWQHLDDYYEGDGTRLPKLWRGKELYTPGRVVLSAVLAALHI